MTLRIKPYGVNAKLIEFDVAKARRRDVRLWIARAVEGPDVVDVVPAARTVLVRYVDAVAARAALPALIELCDQFPPADGVEAENDAAVLDDLVVPVRYDGDDLADVAQHLGVTVDEVIRRHQAAEWVVEFTGFTAGFGYLSQRGEPVNLTVPRRSTPRTRIPEGAVALADDFAGVYPKASPGGWQLLGVTDLAMFDQHRDPPALLQPGRRVKFVDADSAETASASSQGGEKPVGETAEGPHHGDGVEANDPSAVGQQGNRRGNEAVRESLSSGHDGALLGVEAVGPQVLVEDLGRIGSLSVGLATCGAADRPALRLANRIVGNSEDSAGLEILLGGFAVRALSAVVVSVAGAPVNVVLERAGSVQTRETNVPLVLEADDVLKIETPTAGLRNYLAIAGGVRVERVAGSSSSDPTAGIGPAPLKVGDRLCAGSDWQGPSALAENRAPVSETQSGLLVLRATWGPRADWFTEEARRVFTSSTYRVGADGNRVGVRFDGAGLDRDVTDELPSEPLIRGAVQVPADGKPLMFFADHPTTGGYPVIAVIDDADTDLLAQARPGQQIRFAVRGTLDGA